MQTKRLLQDVAPDTAVTEEAGGGCRKWRSGEGEGCGWARGCQGGSCSESRERRVKEASLGHQGARGAGRDVEVEGAVEVPWPSWLNAAGLRARARGLLVQRFVLMLLLCRWLVRLFWNLYFFLFLALDIIFSIFCGLL